MWLNHFLLGIAWIVYCLLHSILAAEGVKKKAGRFMKRGYKYYRPAYTLFSFVTLVLLLWWLVMMNSPRVFQVTNIIFLAGGIISIAGLLIMAACISKYFLSLSGIKTLLDKRQSNELIITGVHRYVRHPLYLGTFMFIWGLWLVVPTISFLISDFIITVYTLIGIRLEEQKLVLEFGQQYKTYQATVPRLWPRLPKKTSSQQ